MLLEHAHRSARHTPTLELLKTAASEARIPPASLPTLWRAGRVHGDPPAQD